MMKTMSVGDFKKDFSAALDRVRRGERIAVSFGRKKEIVAVLSPPDHGETQGKRKLGRYAGRAQVRFSPDWELTDEELLGS